MKEFILGLTVREVESVTIHDGGAWQQAGRQVGRRCGAGTVGAES